MNPAVVGVKEGILLEAGFDNIAPNEQTDITSWAYERAASSGVKVIDNRAKGVACYHPGYTFVEKLQTIATKFRKENENGSTGQNFMRQYYDVYSLLANAKVLDFIGTTDYHAHKAKRFPAADIAIPICENQAFLLDDKNIRASFERRYKNTEALYYNGQPPFSELLAKIREHIKDL